MGNITSEQLNCGTRFVFFISSSAATFLLQSVPETIMRYDVKVKRKKNVGSLSIMNGKGRKS